MKTKQNYSTIKSNLKLVFTKKTYILLTIIISLFFYTLNVFFQNKNIFLTSFNNFGPIQGSLLILNLLTDFYTSIKLHSYISIIIISLLFGILVSLLTYKYIFIKNFQTNSTQKINKNKKFTIFTSLGIFLGIAAPGCAACGVGLLSLLGLSSIITTILPYNGLEISILSILILLISIYNISLNLTTCKIKI